MMEKIEETSNFDYSNMSSMEALLTALADPDIENITIEASGVILHKIPIGYEGHGWYYTWGYDPYEAQKQKLKELDDVQEKV